MRECNFTTIFVGIESPRAASLQETKKTQNLRGDILGSVHKIQQAGMEVMAGMIVGFDHDDPTIFAEQFDFIQDARIPISMTGMLQAMPQTPLYKRMADAGRLLAQSVGDQFVFTNILPESMSRVQLYEGYRDLLQRLYSYRHYRRRTMQLILNKGRQAHSHLMAGRQDVGILLRVVWTCILRASPRRAWLTISLLLETLLRRPRAIRDAVTFALVHKHLYEYMRDTCTRLDELSAQLRALPEEMRVVPAEPPAARLA
jgi:radical SAM superfamily enzyme YgiQ (UPF0313 family)